MNMNDILQIIGSIASIVGIPLTIYLYLKSAAEKVLGVRRDIVTRLALQLGEGRILTMFEVQAVIDARLRENRLKPATIRPNEVINDLVTETIASPLLETSRKEEIVNLLSSLHTLGKLYSTVHDNQKLFEAFLEFLRKSKPESELKELENDSEKLVQAIQSEEIGKGKQYNQTPELFVGTVSIISLVLGIASALGPWLFTTFLNPVVIGTLASLVALSLTVWPGFFILIKHRFEK